MTDETVEVRKDEFEEFLSILDGVCDSIYRNGYDEQVRQMDDLREAMQVESEDENPTELESRGTVEFDGSTEDTFADLVQETLEQSEFIELDWTDANTAVVYEVMD